MILSFDLSPNNYNIIVGYKKYIGILDMGILASYNDIYIYDDVIQIYFSQLVKSYEYSYERIIDKFPENINPVLFKKSEKHLLDLDNYDNWYLVYANQNAVGSSDNDYSQLYVNPVEIMFARDTIYKIATRIAVPITIYPSNITKRPNEGECLQIIDINADVGAYVEIGGTRYNYSSTLGDGNYNAISIFKFGDYDTTFKYIYLYKLNTDGQPPSTITLQNVSAITFYGIPNGKLSTFQGYQFDFTSWWTAKGGSVFYINSSSQATARTSDSYNDIDLTYSQLIKIIALPYAPLEFLNGVYTFESIPDELSWNTTFNFLQVKPSKRIEFDYIIDFGYNSPFSDLVCEENIGAFTKVPRNDIFESKFYNSEFTQNKFVYDQFTFTFQLELVDINEFFAQENYDKFMVEYIVSKKLSSKFIFKFNQYVCGEYEKQDYNNVLIVDRNNEVPLFTNAYINYMRTGFQFDVSNKNNQQVSRWGGIALSTIGAVASFISSAYTGGVGIAGGIALTTSTLSQIVGAITSQNQQENAMAQKQLQASMQSESVQGSDDVELFKQYGQNKAKLVKYQPSEVMSQMIKDLFYYGGYATSEYKIPNINTRIYFNYLQCDLVLDGTSNLPEDIENDIKTKFQSGCTFFHKYDGVWDIAQEYENFEIVFE